MKNIWSFKDVRTYVSIIHSKSNWSVVYVRVFVFVYLFYGTMT